MGRKILIIVGGVFLLAMIALLIISALKGKKTVSTTSLSIWAPFDETQAYKDLTAPFVAANPGVTVDFKYIQAKDAADYEAKVVDAIASGKGPDIWLIRNDWLPKHLPKLIAAPSTLSWSTDKSITDLDALKNYLSPAIYTQNSSQGSLYALPVSTDSLALYINTSVLADVVKEEEDSTASLDLLSQNPKTWDDVAKLAQLITKKDKKGITRSGIALGTIDNTYAATDVLLAMLYQRGGKLYTDDQSVSLHLAATNSSFPGRDSLDFFSSFALPNNPNYSWNSSMGDPVQAFLNGKTGMLVAYSSLQVDLLKLNKDFSDYKIVNLPQFKEPILPTESPINYAVYWTHVVPKNSPNTELAWQLLRSIADPNLLRAYERTTLKPVLGSEGEGRLFAEQATTSAVASKPEWQFVDATLQTMVKDVIDRGQAVQTAIDTAAEQLKKGPQ